MPSRQDRRAPPLPGLYPLIDDTAGRRHFDSHFRCVHGTGNSLHRIEPVAAPTDLLQIVPALVRSRSSGLRQARQARRRSTHAGTVTWPIMSGHAFGRIISGGFGVHRVGVLAASQTHEDQNAQEGDWPADDHKTPETFHFASPLV